MSIENRIYNYNMGEWTLNTTMEPKDVFGSMDNDWYPINLNENDEDDDDHLYINTNSVTGEFFISVSVNEYVDAVFVLTDFPGYMHFMANYAPGLYLIEKAANRKRMEKMLSNLFEGLTIHDMSHDHSHCGSKDIH